MTEYKNHFGIYGVCIKDGKLLCIKKSRGPYTGYFDLPGGSQELGESLSDTLKREILEETGYSLLSYSLPQVYDTFVHEEGEAFIVHHIFAVYDMVIDEDNRKEISEYLAYNEKNDSQGIVWIPLTRLNSSNASPLIQTILMRESGEVKTLQFEHWKRR